MQDTFQWTPELLADFFNSIKILPVDLANGMDEFKQSKSPKKEWEIVAYRNERDVVYTLHTDGRFYIKPDCSYGYDQSAFTSCTIHSVRRLSDGETLNVLDWVKTTGSSKRQITGFSIVENGLLIHFNNGSLNIVPGGPSLAKIEKLSAPILITHDGVEIFEGMEFWGIRDWRVLEGGKADKYDKNLDKATPTFSTREAAEEYILNNKPLLSLNDVKGACRSTVFIGETFLIEKLTAIAKQKLKQ